MTKTLIRNYLWSNKYFDIFETDPSFISSVITNTNARTHRDTKVYVNKIWIILITVHCTCTMTVINYSFIYLLLCVCLLFFSIFIEKNFTFRIQFSSHCITYKIVNTGRAELWETRRSECVNVDVDACVYVGNICSYEINSVE